MGDDQAENSPDPYGFHWDTEPRLPSDSGTGIKDKIETQEWQCQDYQGVQSQGRAKMPVQQLVERATRTTARTIESGKVMEDPTGQGVLFSRIIDEKGGRLY